MKHFTREGPGTLLGDLRTIDFHLPLPIPGSRCNFFWSINKEVEDQIHHMSYTSQQLAV